MGLIRVIKEKKTTTVYVSLTIFPVYIILVCNLLKLWCFINMLYACFLSFFHFFFHLVYVSALAGDLNHAYRPVFMYSCTHKNNCSCFINSFPLLYHLVCNLLKLWCFENMLYPFGLDEHSFLSSLLFFFFSCCLCLCTCQCFESRCFY